MKISVERLFGHDVDAIDVDERLALRGDLKGRYPGGVRVEARIGRISRGVYVEGFVEGVEQETCVRCLERFTRPVRVEIAEPFSEEVAVKDAPISDVAPLVDRTVDFDALVGELLEVDEPIAAICAEDCAGICPTCGRNRNLEPCACDRTARANSAPADERMAGLAKFLQEHEN